MAYKRKVEIFEEAYTKKGEKSILSYDGRDGKKRYIAGSSDPDVEPGGGGGTGIESIEQTVTSEESGGVNVITVTTSDGATTDFQVRNGIQGATGPKGDQGNSGYSGAAGELEVVNNLTTGGEGSALSAEMGKTLKGMIDSKTFPIVNDLTTGGEESALSAEMGKVLADGAGVKEDDFLQIVGYNSFPANQASPIMMAGKTYDIHIKADKPMGQSEWSLSVRNLAGTTTRIKRFGSTDMSVEQIVAYTPSEDIYGIGNGGRNGVQDTSAIITYRIYYGTYTNICNNKEVTMLDEDVVRGANTGSNPNWMCIKTVPIMREGKRYVITIKANESYSPTAWTLACSNSGSIEGRVNIVQITTGQDLSQGYTVRFTPPYDVYMLYCSYESPTADIPFHFNVVTEDLESQRLFDLETRSSLLEQTIAAAQINDFYHYFRIGATKNDTYNIISQPIGLIVMGQSNADGRVPNADFPATATIDTSDDLTLSKELAHCLFMKGDQESTFNEPNKNFAGRNNNAAWSFDDIVYNAVNQALGGNTDFYVIKQTRGGTAVTPGIAQAYFAVDDLLGRGSRNQLQHLKLMYERAMSLNPNINFKAILWNQGEAEYNILLQGRYYDSVVKMIYWIRGLVGNPRLPFIMTTIPTNAVHYSDIVRAGMERVAAEINDCYLFDAGAAEDWADSANPDYMHYGAQTSTKIGVGMYKIMRQNYMLAPMITPI